MVKKSVRPKHVSFLHAMAYAGLLLSYLWVAMFHGTLLQDPIRSMTQTLPFLIIIQIGYCVIALKSDGTRKSNGGSSGANSGSTSRSTLAKHHKSGAEFNNVSTAVLAILLSLILSILVFGLLILFGAPFASLLLETFLCAVHISILSVQPLMFVYNLDSNNWRDIVSAKLPLDGVYGASVGTWIGAWLGAIPIPLDWDRPWQQWPITILSGAYIGTVVGTIIGAIHRELRS